jgi:hypothetical protein
LVVTERTKFLSEAEEGKLAIVKKLFGS